MPLVICDVGELRKDVNASSREKMRTHLCRDSIPASLIVSLHQRFNCTYHVNTLQLIDNARQFLYTIV